MIKIAWVDQEACISCGLCISVAPEVFRFEGGRSFVYDPYGAPEETIQVCIAACPVEAIHWRNK